MKMFKDIARANGINVLDVKYGTNGVLVANDTNTRKKISKIMQNPILRVTYVGEVVDNNLIYTKR